MTLHIILESGFQLHETAAGKIAEFNLWNYAISDELIDFQTCGTFGNVVSWNSLWEEGTSVRSFMDLPGTCGKGMKPNAQFTELIK